MLHKPGRNNLKVTFSYLYFLHFDFKAFGEPERSNRDVEDDNYRSRSDIDRYNPGYNNYFGSNSEDDSSDKDGTFGYRKYEFYKNL